MNDFERKLFVCSTLTCKEELSNGNCLHKLYQSRLVANAELRGDRLQLLWLQSQYFNQFRSRSYQT